MLLRKNLGMIAVKKIQGYSERFVIKSHYDTFEEGITDYTGGSIAHCQKEFCG